VPSADMRAVGISIKPVTPKSEAHEGSTVKAKIMTGNAFDIDTQTSMTFKQKRASTMPFNPGITN